MVELSPELKARIDLVKPMAEDLVAERGITELSKTNNFLPVCLGLRQLALTYLPAEFPGGNRMGEAIDRYFKENYVPGEAPRAGLLNRFRRRGPHADQEAELLAKRRVLEQAYNEIAAGSPAYAAHLDWLDRMTLNHYQVKRRPSLREMFIYRDRRVKDRVVELEDIAEKARQRVAEGPGDRAPLEYVYANEFDPKYLRGLGEMLGYPACCVERYVEDRMKGQNVEQRAWEQVHRMQSDGKSVDIHAYYVKDFFPCTPDCEAARAQGELWEAAYEALSPDLRDMYVGAMYQCFELVQNYPVLITQHRQRLEQGRS
jgi:hypothetical protein